MKIISRLFVSFVAVSAISSNAALYDRGNGMIYDSTQNITWLQDANYGRFSGYDSGGFMTWQQATTWTANLVYGGYSDWRLPSAHLIGNPYFSYNGSSDYGYNNSRSEMGHLFLELGNKAYYSNTGNLQSNYGWINTSFLDARTGQTVSFLNIQLYSGYWEAEASATDSSKSWNFNPFYGDQRSLYQHFGTHAWAVRDGDVLPVNEVPVPTAAWLMGSGLIGLAGIARRKK